MGSFKSPRRGSNVVHRLDLPGLSAPRRRRRVGDVGAPAPGPGGEERLRPYLLPAAASLPPATRDQNGGPRPSVLRPVAVGFRLEPTNGRSEPTNGLTTDAAPDLVSERAADKAQMDRLERRLAKLSQLLDDRDEELLSLSGQKLADEHGVASVFRSVQGVKGRGVEAKRRKEFMSKIFEANLKLRERVTSTTAGAE